MTENGTHTKPGMLRAFPRLAPVRLALFFVVLLAAYAGAWGRRQSSSRQQGNF